MSDARKDGGPAFPDSSRKIADVEGMSLRQWYAGQAVQNFNLHGESPARAAEWAFAIADAMIAFEKAEQR